MTVIVTDTGFTQEDFIGTFSALDQSDNANAIELANDTCPTELDKALHAKLIRIAFPSFADGRGFTLAAQLRRLGYKGRIRAYGHVIADQYAMARRSGFDEIEISDDLAARQSEEQWLRRANWQAHDYQARMRA